MRILSPVFVVAIYDTNGDKTFAKTINVK